MSTGHNFTSTLNIVRPMTENAAKETHETGHLRTGEVKVVGFSKPTLIRITRIGRTDRQAQMPGYACLLIMGAGAVHAVTFHTLCGTVSSTAGLVRHRAGSTASMHINRMSGNGMYALVVEARSLPQLFKSVAELGVSESIVHHLGFIHLMRSGPNNLGETPQFMHGSGHLKPKPCVGRN